MYSKDSKTTKLCLVIFLVLNFSACWINAPFDEIAFEAEVRNESDHAVLVKILNSSRVQIVTDSIEIQPNNVETICFYTSINFSGFLCELTGLEFRFSNGKGYTCIKGDNFLNASDSCFLIKDPLDPTINAAENGTIFVVTQEDFENAREI